MSIMAQNIVPCKPQGSSKDTGEGAKYFRSENSNVHVTYGFAVKDKVKENFLELEHKYHYSSIIDFIDEHFIYIIIFVCSIYNICITILFKFSVTDNKLSIMIYPRYRSLSIKNSEYLLIKIKILQINQWFFLGGKISGVRYLQSFLLFLCLFAAYLLRVSISVAIVAMTPDKNSTDFLLETHYHIPVFNWTQHTKSLILSAFFWGYLIMNLPAAMIGRRYNNQMLLAMSMMLTVALSLATPSLVVAFNWPVLVLIRFLQGLTQAFTMPMIHGISAKWAPPNERGRLVGFVLGGLQFGTVVTLICSGILASTRSGWPSIYYFSGAFGIFWVILWLLLGSESPDTHRLITQSEKNYIKSSLTQTVSEKKNLITPWKEIFTSMPVWAVTISHAGHNCGFWLLLSEMPTFISSVLKFDIKSDGLVSALPYLAMWLCQFPVTYLADYMNKKNVTSLTFSRKFWNTLGNKINFLKVITFSHRGRFKQILCIK
ncbi:hypothetical protein QTP88_022357 [Uroleucon formosanum]